jgi:hypothetical protein
MFGPRMVKKINTKKVKRNFINKKFKFPHTLCSSIDVEKLSVSPVLSSAVFRSLVDLLSVSLPLIL